MHRSRDLHELIDSQRQIIHRQLKELCECRATNEKLVYLLKRHIDQSAELVARQFEDMKSYYRIEESSSTEEDCSD
jgi:hypothetical protein